MGADWTDDELDRLAASRPPRRKLNPDGSVRLTRDEAARTVAALLFYLRAWDADPTDPDRSNATGQLAADCGEVARQVLDSGIFPAEVGFDAEQLWTVLGQQRAGGA